MGNFCVPSSDDSPTTKISEAFFSLIFFLFSVGNLFRKDFFGIFVYGKLKMETYMFLDIGLIPLSIQYKASSYWTNKLSLFKANEYDLHKQIVFT